MRGRGIAAAAASVVIGAGVAVVPVTAIDVAVAAPAEAHTAYCGHGDHTAGHSDYMVSLRSTKEVLRGNRLDHVHMVSVYGKPTATGSYPKYIRSFPVTCQRTWAERAVLRLKRLM